MVARHCLAAGLLIAVSLSARAAYGQDFEAMHTHGNQLRAAHRDAEARDVFRRIYEQTHEPRALARMGLAEAAMQDWAHAEAHLTGALAVQSDPWVIQNRTQPEGGLEGALRTAQLHVGSLTVAAAVRGAGVWIGQEQVGTLPLQQPLRVAAGSVTFQVRAPGYLVATQTVTVAPGTSPETVQVYLAADPSAASRVAATQPGASVPPVGAPPQVERASPGAGAGPWILGGAGVVALGLAGVFWGVMEQAAVTDRTRACPDSLGICYPTALDAQNRAETAALLTNVSLGVGAAAVVGGAIWFVAGGGFGHATERTAWTVDAHALAGGGMMTVRGAF